MDKAIALACHFYSHTNWRHGIFWTSPLGAINISTKILFSAILFVLKNPKRGTCGVAITKAEEQAIWPYSDHRIIAPKNKIVILLSYLLILPLLILFSPALLSKIANCNLPNYFQLRFANRYALAIMILAGLCIGFLLKRRVATFYLATDHCPLILSVGFLVKDSEIVYTPHGWNFGNDNSFREKSIFSKAIARDCVQSSYFHEIFDRNTSIVVDPKATIKSISGEDRRSEGDHCICIWLTQMDFFLDKKTDTRAAIKNFLQQTGSNSPYTIYISVKSEKHIKKFEELMEDESMDIRVYDRKCNIIYKNFVINSNVSYDILKEVGSVYVSSQNCLVGDATLKKVITKHGYVVNELQNEVFLVKQNYNKRVVNYERS